MQADELTLEVEVLDIRPGEADDVEPFLRILIAWGVLAHRRPEHVELALVPAAHDIQAEAALADMIGGGELLGRDQRMDQRCMHRAEYCQVLRRGEQAGCPGNSLQRL